MTTAAQFPTSTVSYGSVAETGDEQTLLCRNSEAISARFGIIPAATASTRIAPAGGTTNLTLASGCLRHISTVGIATGMTLTIQTTGAVQGQIFRIVKTSTGGTGAVVIDSHSFTTKKRFGCELVFINGYWRMVSWAQYT